LWMFLFSEFHLSMRVLYCRSLITRSALPNTLLSLEVRTADARCTKLGFGFDNAPDILEWVKSIKLFDPASIGSPVAVFQCWSFPFPRFNKRLHQRGCHSVRGIRPVNIHKVTHCQSWVEWQAAALETGLEETQRGNGYIEKR
jgi:hypothetical protein